MEHLEMTGRVEQMEEIYFLVVQAMIIFKAMEVLIVFLVKMVTISFLAV